MTPRRPLAVTNFSDEEGGRWGIACVGSRLMTGQVDPFRMLARQDVEGVTLAAAMEGAGLAPAVAGPDAERLARIGTFVEAPTSSRAAV